ncbi:MAG: OadG family protein [Cytophagales bacterium]|nr:OadG family protein [Cytophagales bacterium]
MSLLGEVVFDLSRITSEYTTLAFVGYLIVFVALITLYFVFQYVPVLLNMYTKRRLKKNMRQRGIDDNVIEDLTISGEVSAAISAALHLYFNEMHDDEKTVLTIKKISSRYSPWSSKIYNVTRGLNRRF